MAVALEDLKVYINDDGNEHDALLTDALTDAAALITKYVGASAVPVNVLDRCTLIVAADLWERRNAPNGIANQQYATVDGIGQSPMRVARDPMAGAYPILRRYVLPW